MTRDRNLGNIYNKHEASMQGARFRRGVRHNTRAGSWVSCDILALPGVVGPELSHGGQGGREL